MGVLPHAVNHSMNHKNGTDLIAIPNHHHKHNGVCSGKGVMGGFSLQNLMI